MNNRIVPTLSMKLHNQAAASVTVQADKTAVLFTYWDAKDNVLAVRDFSIKDNPELLNICRDTTFDVLWDIEMVLDLLDDVDENEPVCDVEPAWKWAGPWVDVSTPAFRNLPQQASVA